MKKKIKDNYIKLNFKIELEKIKNKEQYHPSSVGPAVHHQTLQASFSFSSPHRKPFNRPVSKIPQRALHKQAQTSKNKSI